MRTNFKGRRRRHHHRLYCPPFVCWRTLAFYLTLGLVLVFGAAAHAAERSHAFEARGLTDTALIAKWCETPASKGHPPTGRMLRWCCHQYIGVKSAYSLADKCSELWKREGKDNLGFD